MTEPVDQTVPSDADHRELIESLSRVGAAWARYGLGIAQVSVEASARTLDLAASALGMLADGFGRFQTAAREKDDFIDVPAEPAKE